MRRIAMSSVPAVVVKKGGLLSAPFYGFFGFLITTVVCVTGLGVYGMWIAENKVDRVFSTGERLIAGIPEWLNALPEWDEALPPAMADALHDRREPDYRQHVDVAVRLVPERYRANRQHAVVEVTNNGTDTISLMALRIVITDEDGVPVYERAAYVATPLTIEGEWRGPLLPDSTRKFTVRVFTDEPDEYEASYEVTEIRIWDPAAAAAVRTDAEGTDSAP
jgi:hypothetical protein